jgi:hypothetical protein
MSGVRLSLGFRGVSQWWKREELFGVNKMASEG